MVDAKLKLMLNNMLDDLTKKNKGWKSLVVSLKNDFGTKWHKSCYLPISAWLTIASAKDDSFGFFMNAYKYMALGGWKLTGETHYKLSDDCDIPDIDLNTVFNGIKDTITNKVMFIELDKRHSVVGFFANIEDDFNKKTFEVRITVLTNKGELEPFIHIVGHDTFEPVLKSANKTMEKIGIRYDLDVKDEITKLTLTTTKSKLLHVYLGILTGELKIDENNLIT